MDTSRGDGVKAPLHDGTPRYAHTLDGDLGTLIARREDHSAEGAGPELLVI